MQTFTGKQYLKIDIATNFGLDKDDWSTRLAWFDQNEHQLLSLVPQSAEPALFFAGVKAWEDTLAGKPSGYMISLDATSSGLQILAALTGDRSAAEICNVVDTGTCKDAYMEAYTAMKQLSGSTGNISRAMAKEAIMTSLYGSEAVPKKVFGSGELLSAFYQTMENLAPGCWELNEAMLDLWDPTAKSYDWVMPDNFNVKTKVMTNEVERIHFLDEPYDVINCVNKAQDKGRSLGANLVHSIDGMIVREITRRCDYSPEVVWKARNLLADRTLVGKRYETVNDKMVRTLWSAYKQSGYLSARILDYLEPENFSHVERAPMERLLNSLSDTPFKVVSVHDCFRVLPNYGDELRRQYNTQLQEIASSELLSYLVSQIIKRPIQIGKLDPTLHQDIAAANYAVC